MPDFFTFSIIRWAFESFRNVYRLLFFALERASPWQCERYVSNNNIFWRRFHTLSPYCRRTQALSPVIRWKSYCYKRYENVGFRNFVAFAYLVCHKYPVKNLNILNVLCVRQRKSVVGKKCCHVSHYWHSGNVINLSDFF
jgi:hypothetical protein